MREPILLTAVLAVLVGAAGPTESDRNRNRARFASLAPAERAKIAENFAEFEQLPDAERERIRGLHQAIETDPDRARLADTLVRYHRWHRLLTPAQQERIAGATTPADRLAVVEHILEEQRASLETRLRPLLNPPEPRFPGGYVPGPRLPPRVSGLDAEEVFKSIADAVFNQRDRLSNEELRRIQEYPDADRPFYILALAIEHDLIPPPLEPVLDPLFDHVYSQTEAFRKRFGAASYADLSPADRAEFRKDVSKLFVSLPPLDPKTVEEFVRQHAPHWADKLSGPMGGAFARMATIGYYKEHPDKVPEEAKAVLRQILGDPAPGPGPGNRRFGPEDPPDGRRLPLGGKGGELRDRPFRND